MPSVGRLAMTSDAHIDRGFAAFVVAGATTAWASPLFGQLTNSSASLSQAVSKLLIG
jgi:hypothetical protein